MSVILSETRSEVRANSKPKQTKGTPKKPVKTPKKGE